MMKKIYLLVVLLVVAFNVNAQINQVIDGLKSPVSIAFIGDNMFVAEIGSNQISKINLTAETPSIDVIAKNLNFPSAIAVKGNDLYVSEYTVGKISKINPFSGEKEDYITKLNTPYALFVNGNDLLFSEDIKGGFSEINTSSNENITISNNLNSISGFALYNGDLYVTQYREGIVSKINLSNGNSTVVLSNLNGPTSLAFFEDTLYIAEIDGNKVTTVDMTASTPEALPFLDMVRPSSLVIKNNDLYIAEFTGTISKINLSTQPTNSPIAITDITVSPNPAKNYINISGLNKTENFKIYDVTGKKILEGTLTQDNATIDVQNLTEGMYLIRISDSFTSKFVKK